MEVFWIPATNLFFHPLLLQNSVSLYSGGIFRYLVELYFPTNNFVGEEKFEGYSDTAGHQDNSGEDHWTDVEEKIHRRNPNGTLFEYYLGMKIVIFIYSNIA